MTPQDVAHHLLFGTTLSRFSFGQGVFVLGFSRWSRAEFEARVLPPDVAIEVQGDLRIDGRRAWDDLHGEWSGLPGGDDAVRAARLVALAASGDDAVVTGVEVLGPTLVIHFAGGVRVSVACTPANMLPDWLIFDSQPAAPARQEWSVYSEAGRVEIRVP